MTSYRDNKTDAQVVEQGIAMAMSRLTVTDTLKAWEPDQWKGRAVRFRGGNNAGAVGVIASNGPTSFTLVTALSKTIETSLTTVYEILAGVSADATAGLLAALLASQDEQAVLLRQIRYGIQVIASSLTSGDVDLTSVD